MRPKKKFNWRTYLRSAARRIWLWHPIRREAIKLARTRKGYVGCKKCSVEMKENVKPKGYDVDHIIPASETANQIENWHDFLTRLLDVTVEDVQVLCKECHDVKTQKENQTRRSKPLGRLRTKVPRSTKRN